MGFDQDLAARVREQLAGEPQVAEKAMFGGLSFLLAGNMAVGILGDELLVRVGREAHDEALARPHTRIFDMSGRPMSGWLLVAADGVATAAQLQEWIGRGVAFARTLPPKG